MTLTCKWQHVLKFNFVGPQKKLSISNAFDSPLTASSFIFVNILLTELWPYFPSSDIQVHKALQSPNSTIYHGPPKSHPHNIPGF